MELYRNNLKNRVTFYTIDEIDKAVDATCITANEIKSFLALPVGWPVYISNPFKNILKILLRAWL